LRFETIAFEAELAGVAKDGLAVRLRHQEEAEHEAHRRHQDWIEQGIAEAERAGT